MTRSADRDFCFFADGLAVIIGPGEFKFAALHNLEAERHVRIGRDSRVPI